MAWVSALSGGFFVQRLNFQISFKEKVKKYKATFKTKHQLLFSTVLKSFCSIPLQVNVHFVLQKISLRMRFKICLL